MLRETGFLGVLVVFSTLAPAQVSSPLAGGNDPASLFGSGDGPEMKYAGEQRPMDLVLGGIEYEAAYDDNPLGTFNGTSGDMEQAFGGNFFFQHRGSHIQTIAGYLPYYERYHTYSQYNQFDQLSSVDLQLIYNANWSARIRDSYSRQTGRYAPLVSGGLPAAVGGPAGLNDTVYTPVGMTEANMGRIDLMYKHSLRSFVDLFGGYEQRHLSQPAVEMTLYNTRGPHAGVEFAWRPSEHSIIGILGLWQRLEFPGATGIPARIEVASVLPTWGSAPAPGWKMQAYAGPQIWGEPKGSGGNGTRNLAWAGGGTLSWGGDRSVSFVTAGHMLSDGGGLLPIVESSTVEAGLRHRLTGLWDAGLQAAFTSNSALDRAYGSDSLREASATAEVVRPLRGNLVWHIDYNFSRQFSSSGSPTPAEFHRNRIASGLSWQFTALPLGR